MDSRNRDSIHHLDPARMDLELITRLFEQFGDAHFNAQVPGLREALAKLEPEPPFLDEWEAPAGADVGDMVKKLQNWCNPDPDSPENRREPPLVMFVWGKFNFTGKLASVNATFDLFRKDGTPARADVVVSIKERPDETVPTNPTSGGPPGRRSRTIIEGDTLQGVAFRELGDANLWRVIAEMNDIDDPMDVPAGTVVLVPSADDATQARRHARAGAS